MRSAQAVHLRHGNIFAQVDELLLDGKTRQGFHQTVDLPRGLQQVKPPQREKNLLFDFAAIAVAPDNLEICGAAGVAVDADDRSGITEKGRPAVNDKWRVCERLCNYVFEFLG
ncbi:MAG: hypothetical protein AAB268_09980 [Elusimicrobiota bacterium]